MTEKNKKTNVFIGWLRSMFLGFNHGAQMDIFTEEQMRSPFRTIVKNFFEKRLAVFGLTAFLLIIIACFTLSALFPLDLYYNDSTQQNISPGFTLLSIPASLQGKTSGISIGSTFSIGVDTAGNLYQWGKPTSRLKQIPNEAKSSIALASAGNDHALAVTRDNEVLTWGNNRFNLTDIPKELQEGKDIRQIFAGDQFSLVLTEEQTLYFWGNSSLVTLQQSSIPKDVQGRILYFRASSDNVILVLDDLSLRVLGIKGTPAYNIPDGVNGRVADVAMAKDAIIALTEDGIVYAWGQNKDDLLNVPEEIQGHTRLISAGRAHFVAVTDDNKVYAWGKDNNKQLSIPAALRNGEVEIASIESGYYQSYAVDVNGNTHAWGLKGYLLGTDGFGRDMFRRLIAGGRLTLTVGAVAVIISLFIGVVIGSLAGFYGKWIDNMLMRFAEIVGAIPFLPFAMTLSVVLGNNVSEMQRIYIIMVIMGILSWPGLARLVRGQILAEREKEFVTAARAVGIRERVIIFRHILPNVISVIIVNATLSYASSMLTESSLSFLGFGVMEPSPTWGNMITGAQSSNIIANYWWRWAFPAISLSLSTISINLLGEGLRDAIDPKSSER